MSHPHLAFCPYLSMAEAIQFADWELGPLKAFENRWADQTFKAQSKLFLSKFVDQSGESIEAPTLLCRRGGLIDGALPAAEEVGALEAAISFAFLEENPRCTPTSRHHAWKVITADNTDLYFWPIDLDAGQVTVTTGLMVRTTSGGFRLSDPELVIRPRLDLHYMRGARTAHAGCLEAMYRTVVESFTAPGTRPAADRLRAAVGWFVKAWGNTATVHYPERLVFLKTGFEAITGTSQSWKSAQALRQLFEGLPNVSPQDSEQLIWSPREQPVHPRTFKIKGQQRTELITDLEVWFMTFADARNMIVHDGIAPDLNYTGANPAYSGPLVFTAEFLLRAAIKASLEGLGHPDLWRSPLSRAIRTGWAKMNASQTQPDS
jgi:hypothetical protein